MAISLPIGASNSGTNDWSDVHGNDAQLVTEIDARDDNYQTIFTAQRVVGKDATAQTYLFASGANPTPDQAESGYGWGATTAGMFSLPYIYFDDADFTVASKTQKLRVRAQVAANATAPGITFTVGLYPLTVAGSADQIAFTAGTVVTGSTIAFVTPSASTITQGNSGDLTIPADGAYGFAVATSATIANNSAVLLSAQLQTRHV